MENPHKILGVPENANKDAIVRRYDILLRKYRQGLTEADDAGSPIPESDIHEAYNLLMGYGTTRPAPPPDEKNIFGISKYKWDNFFHYHRIHILVGLIALVVAGFFIKDIVTRVEPDFNLIVQGAMYMDETQTKALEDLARQVVPTLKAPQVQVMTLTDDDKSEQSMAIRMKAVAVLAAGDVDIMFLDTANYKSLAEQGALVDVTEIAARLGVTPDPALKVAPKDGKEGIFGIDVGKSASFEKINKKDTRVIAALTVRTKKSEEAVAIIAKMLTP